MILKHRLMFLLLVPIFFLFSCSLDKFEKQMADEDKLLPDDREIQNDVEPDTEIQTDTETVTDDDGSDNEIEADDEAEADNEADLDDNEVYDDDTVVIVPVCGNGILESGEECDDANKLSNDDCTIECKHNICGDGYINNGVEECDGSVISCYILGFGTGGKAPCNGVCDGFVTEYNCTRYFSCKAKPANSLWNTVSGYVQTWTGIVWEPVEDENTNYDTESSDESCQYICEAGYEVDAEDNCVPIPDPCQDDLCGGIENGTGECDPEETTAGSGLFTGNYSCICNEGFVWYEGACVTEWDEISAGQTHTCGITNGKLYCWGANWYGQLGNGVSDTVFFPVRVGSETGWQKISASDDMQHTCGILNGELYCWGDNLHETIGFETIEEIRLPERIGFRNDWTEISTSENHSCGIAGGELYCWGNNNSGQLGDGTFLNRITPVRIGNRNDWSSISTSYRNTCGIAQGNLFCWGYNQGYLFDGALVEKPYPVKIGNKASWEKISLGTYSFCGIADSELFCWGAGYSTPGNGEPYKFHDQKGWSDVNLGGSFGDNDLFACGVLSGKLYCWGGNDKGQLGDGTFISRSSPVRIGLEDNWENVDAGFSHTCGISEGILSCWGYKAIGVLGIGGSAFERIPSETAGNHVFDNFDAGQYNTCGVSANEIYCWGFNDSYSGCIGYDTPVKKTGSHEWETVSIGISNICGIADGKLYCWGIKESADPSMIGSKSTWTAISAGGYLNYHSACGIAEGKLFCFGKNGYGQLGDGTNIDRDAPVPVGDLSSWEKISVSFGFYGQTQIHTCGIADGAMYCWGNNIFGQLGDSTEVSKFDPVRVGELNNWDVVSTGVWYTCGIAEGELYCWGKNANGQLGDNSNINKSAPVRIGERTDWETVSAGLLFTCGIAGGELYCWGESYIFNNGQSKVPEQLVSGSDWESVSCGETHVCARSNGTLYCWGENSYGQLGDGSAWIETPEKVLEP